LTLLSLGIITAIVLVFVLTPCIPNPCLSSTTITFQFFAGTTIFSFLPMLPFLPTGPVMIRTYARTLYIAYPIPRLERFLTLTLARKSPELLLDFIFFLFFIRFFFWMEGT
jgi:hypothetical protein